MLIVMISTAIIALSPNIALYRFFFFFFSSRRRHTRSLCDWSSDVCSSDLVRDDRARALRARLERHVQRAVAESIGLQQGRSEERRVGKECRSRWSPYQ